jgi:predicted nucleotide-binding protein
MLRHGRKAARERNGLILSYAFSKRLPKRSISGVILSISVAPHALGLSSATHMTKRVFMIHGRDEDARDVLADFVRSLGLEPLLFEHVRASLGGNPFIYNVVRAGIREANAVIALFTPDEHAAFYDRNGALNIGEQRWQARQNVIFEAGVAYGISQKKTILVSLGSDVRLFSDVEGKYIIPLGASDGKEQLRSALKKLFGELPAGALGIDFKACLRHRWTFYDELDLLEKRLRHRHVNRGKTALFEVLASVVAACPEKNWSLVTSSQFMELIADNATPSVTEDVYWWLIVYGVFEFTDTGDWWHDSPTWRSSVDYTKLSDRGQMLLRKISDVACALQPV